MDEEIDECTCLSDAGLGAPVPCTVHDEQPDDICVEWYRVLAAQRPGSAERCWTVWDERKSEVVWWTTTQRSAWAMAHRLAARDAVADDVARLRASNARLLEALAILGVEWITDDEVIGPYWLPAPEGQPVAGDAVEAATARRARIAFDGEAEETRATLLAAVERHRKSREDVPRLTEDDVRAALDRGARDAAETMHGLRDISRLTPQQSSLRLRGGTKRHPLGERHGRAVEAVLRSIEDDPDAAALSARAAVDEALRGMGLDPDDVRAEGEALAQRLLANARSREACDELTRMWEDEYAPPPAGGEDE